MRTYLLTMVGLLASGTGAAAEHSGHALGKVEFPISCSQPAQLHFNGALALLHHMTYPQARQGFEKVASIDPTCAMAHWGIAMTLFQPLWPTRPGLEARQRGWQEVQKAKQLAPPTQREQLFVAAAAAFFQDPEAADYWQRIGRWEQSMAQAYATLPNDPEVAVFYALAHLATSPTNKISREHADASAAILQRVYERHPDHPGVMHYIVHANDVPGREQELLEITRKYEAVAPRNPHALHMPTHIYTRLGDWEGVTRGNLRAAEAALEHPAGDRGEFVWDEFPHAIEYLVYAYLQQGNDEQAAAQLERLRTTANLEPSFKTAFHLASTRARYALERRSWNEAALIKPSEPRTVDWKRFTWPEAISQFAHGLGAAHLGKVDDANAASQRLQQLETATRTAGEDLFARSIQVLRLELSGWTEHAKGQSAASVKLLREAAELEASTPKHAVTPGPTLPAFELLGDLLMEQKQPTQALVAYRRAIQLYPKRFNGLLGAARAARDSEDEAAARTFYSQLLDVADGEGRRSDLAEARKYLQRDGKSVRQATAHFLPNSASNSARALSAADGCDSGFGAPPPNIASRSAFAFDAASRLTAE